MQSVLQALPRSQAQLTIAHLAQQDEHLIAPLK